MGVYLDFADAIKRDGLQTIKEKYGNLLKCTNVLQVKTLTKYQWELQPVHYTMVAMGRHNLQSTIPGLHVAKEANFSDHSANRLGASALIPGLADGPFVLPQTIGNYLAEVNVDNLDNTHPAFEKAKSDAQAHLDKLMAVKGTQTLILSKELGKIMLEYCGMARNKEGLEKSAHFNSKVKR